MPVTEAIRKGEGDSENEVFFYVNQPFDGAFLFFSEKTKETPKVGKAAD